MIIRNSARCNLCGDEIESTYRHDFKSCKCGAIFVDGGHAYLRRGANNLSDIIDTSIIEKDEK
jgi:hypothetical protein